MQDLTKLQDMFVQLEPAAQKIIIDLMEILYKRNETPDNMNIFDFKKEVKNSGFAKRWVKDVDDFNNPNKEDMFDAPITADYNKEKVAISKEEKEDIEEFITNEPEPEHKILEFSAVYRMKVLKMSGLKSLYKGKNPMVQNSVVTNLKLKRDEILQRNPIEVEKKLAEKGWSYIYNPTTYKKEKGWGVWHLAAYELGYLNDEAVEWERQEYMKIVQKLAMEGKLDAGL